MTRDITERREAQRAMDALREQMAQAQKLEALGQLTGGIAHNFSNLLQIVLSGVRLAQGLAGENERLRRILAEIGEAAENRAGLTRHLLAFSRKLPTRPEVIDTAGHLRRAADLFGPSLRGDIQVDLDLEDGLWPIRVDAAQFELALLNVALNARDAMPEGGLLAVSAGNVALREAAPGLRGRFVAVRLRDTGTGIPEEVLGRVFEPFFTTKPPGQGTGLGLSQAHGFAEEAGGALRIESEPGRGTEVTFFLPAAAAARSDAARGDAHVQAADPGTPAPGNRAARVLVVDDEAAVGRLAAGMLEGAGYRAEAVTGPEAALERLEGGERFDLVFSDVLMRHRQVVGSWVSEFASRGRCWHGVQAAGATPLMSAHTPNARALAARYSLAETWSRRRWKRLPIWSWAERKRCAWPADLKRFICRSRRRVGWCEFSARLLRPLCRRCSTPGISSFFAAP